MFYAKIAREISDISLYFLLFAGNMVQEYSYRCKDYSLLTPPFKKWVVVPLFKLVPRGIPANIITIFSNVFIYASLYLAYNQELLGSINLLIIPLFILFYLIGDHLDGMQAKNTGTGSALGEFCDHYHDSFNNGILMIVIFLLFDISNPYLVALMISISYMAHTVVFYEQFKTGWLIFEKVGSLEAVLFTIILVLLAYIPSVSLFYQLKWTGLTIITWVMLISTLGGLGTVIKTVIRLDDVTYAFWMYLISIVVIGYLSATMFSPFVVFIMLTLYSSVYIGKLMQGHLVDGLERSPGLFTPVALIIYYFTGFNTLIDFRLIIAIYLIIEVILVIYKTTKPLGQYWVWWNPRMKQ